MNRFCSIALFGTLLSTATATMGAAIGDPNDGNGWDTTSAVTITASSYWSWNSASHFLPERLIDGSGIYEGGWFHHSAYDDAHRERMWLSGWENNDANPAVPSSDGNHWLLFTFDQAYDLGEMWIWNYNEIGSPTSGGNYRSLGVKGVTIEYSLNGTDWTGMFDGDIPITDDNFFEADGDSYLHGPSFSLDFEGASAQYVRINIDLGANRSYNGTSENVGLSEVRFNLIPEPASLSLLAMGGLLLGRRRGN